MTMAAIRHIFKCFKTPKSGSYFILNFVLEVTKSWAKSKDQRLELVLASFII
jgi:hypothetical protein